MINPLYLTTVFLIEPLPDHWPEQFAVVTASNPHGQAMSELENQRRETRLSEVIRSVNCWSWRVTGSSPDLAHREVGYAVELGQAAALELSKQFDQEAIFWIERDQLSIIAGHQREDLGSWRERINPGVIG